MWYKPANESSLFTPALLVFPDRIEENIRRMITIAGDTNRLRPHVKTHKMAEVVGLQVSYGIRKFKCATLPELEMVVSNGGTDILLAYPLLGPGISQFLDLIQRFPKAKLSVNVDSFEACKPLNHLARLRGLKVNVFVDLDNGMHRTGITPEKSVGLIDFILDTEHLKLGGLHIYDGHIHESDLIKRKARCDLDFEEVDKLMSELQEKGVKVEEVACGGTPTFPIHAMHKSRTLCPGTPLLWDAGYARTLPDLKFLPAAVVVGRVISKPGGNVCLDLGHKAIASEMPHPRLQFLNLAIRKVVNHSEEHLVVSVENSPDWSIGDLVYAVPTHVCPTVALHEHVYVIKNKQVNESWRVQARHRKH